MAGDSAGGHLALMSALLPAGSAFDRACPAPDATRWSGGADAPLNVAAVVNWFGIGDVEAMLEGPQQRHYAIEWFGSNSERQTLARQISPLRLVRAGLPPIISVHGRRDPVVPYSQAETLHAALAGAGVPNRLVTIETGNHGGFSDTEAQAANAAIRQFLRQHGLPVAP